MWGKRNIQELHGILRMHAPSPLRFRFPSSVSNFGGMTVGEVIGKGGGWFVHWMYYQNSYVWSFPRDLQRYRALEPYVGHLIHYERNSEQVTWEVKYGESAIELFLSYAKNIFSPPETCAGAACDGRGGGGGGARWKIGRVRSGLAAEFQQCGARHCVTSKCCGPCSRNSGRTATVATQYPMA